MLLRRLCPWCCRYQNRASLCCLPLGDVGLIARRIDGLDGAWAAHRYEGAARSMVLAGKNGGRRDLLGLLGRDLATRLRADDDPRIARVLVADPIVVWAPASRSGRRRRGFDQGRLLARAVGRHLGLTVRPLMVRTDRLSQATGGRQDRLNRPAVRCRSRVTGPVLLVDDVITTGASLAATGRALRQAGASAVIGAAVATSGR